MHYSLKFLRTILRNALTAVHRSLTLLFTQVFYCVTLHPDEGKQNVLMAGCSDKKIYQFDIDTGDTVQVC
jgi:hypothetical protein